MPIEDKPTEIRARVRDPNDFSEIYGYMDIDAKNGIRAIYGKLTAGKDAIQAYRFNKAFGWDMAKAKKWLSDHGISPLSKKGIAQGWNLSDEYLSFEAGLFKGFKGAQGLIQVQRNARGPPIKLMDVLARLGQDGPIIDDVPRVSLIGSLVEHGGTIRSIVFGVHGKRNPNLEAAILERLTPTMRERAKFVQLNLALQSPHVPLAVKQYRPILPHMIQEPRTPTKLTALEPNLLWSDGVINKPDDIKDDQYPVYMMALPRGVKCQVHLTTKAQTVTGENGQPIAISKGEKLSHSLLTALGDKTVLSCHLIRNPSGEEELQIDDVYLLDGEEVWRKPFMSRWEDLTKALGSRKPKGWSLAPYAKVQNGEALNKLIDEAHGKAYLKLGPLSVSLEHSCVGSAMVLPGETIKAQVVAVKSEPNARGDGYRYLLGINSSQGLVPLGVSGLTQLEAKVGDPVLVNLRDVNVHYDKESDRLWLDGQGMDVLRTGVHQANDGDGDLESLVWLEQGAKEPKPYPAFFEQRARTGLFSNEWENHLAKVRWDQYLMEALEERAAQDRAGWKPVNQVELCSYPRNSLGRFRTEVHLGQIGKYPTHIDLRLEMDDHVQVWAIENDGKKCCCEDKAQPEQGCLAMEKAPQNKNWLNGAPSEFSDYYELLANGTYEPGVQSTHRHEYFLRAEKEFMGAKLNKRIIFQKIMNQGQAQWILLEPSDQKPFMLNPNIIKEGYVPPYGQSCLPSELANKIPTELRYWLLEDEKARLEALKALHQTMAKKEIRLFAEKVEVLCVAQNVREVEVLDAHGQVMLRAYNFSLQKQNWKDKNGLEHCRDFLHIQDGSGTMTMKLGADILGCDGLDAEPLEFEHGLTITGNKDLVGTHSLAPTLGQASSLSLVDMGKVIIYSQNDSQIKLAFKGKVLKGRWTINRSKDQPIRLAKDASSEPSQDVNLPLVIRGIALTEGKFNGKWYSKEDVRKAKLVPFPQDQFVRMRTDHSKSVWDICGKVKKLWWEENHKLKDGRVIPAQMFEAEITDETMARAILNGDIDAVSIGALVDTDYTKEPPEVHDIEIQEISLVAVPACSGCRIETAQPT